jgi:hypothetical protein
MLPISLGLQVLVPAMSGDNYPNTLPADADEEFPFPAFNTRDCIWLRQLPLSAVVTADILNSLVRVIPVSFVDALDLIRLWHLLSFRLGGNAQPLESVVDLKPIPRYRKN